MMSRALGIGAMVCLVMVARVAVAQALAAEGAAAKGLEHLTWVIADGAVGCPDAAEFRRRLEGRMGMDPFASATAPDFEVRLRRERGKFVADIRQATDGAGTSRSIGGDANTCDELVDAVVLTFSLLLETNPAEVASDQPKAKAVCPAVVCPQTDCPTCPELPKRDIRSAWLAVGPAFPHSDLPSFAVGAMLATGLGLADPWELTAGAAHFNVEQSNHSGARFIFTNTEAWLGLGVTLPLAARLRWRAQLAPVAGILRGFLVSPISEAGDSTYLGVRLASQAAFRVLGPLGIAVGLSCELLAKRWGEFHALNNEGIIWTQSRFGGRAETLLGWELK